MTAEEFKTLQGMLKVYGRGIFATEAEIKEWYESLRKYDFATIERAARDYIQSCQYTPTPAAIIGMIPRAKPGNTQKSRFAKINGKWQRVISCRRCMDTGLITWDDADGRTYGRPCDCEAGHVNYRGAWEKENRGEMEHEEV